MENVTISQACDFLQKAEIKACDLLISGSNYVFLAKMVKDKTEIMAIYKPRQGETPLWDFPDGTLYKREYATFVLSQALEWYLVPPTVIRNGPFGVGTMQWSVGTMAETKHYARIIREPSVIQLKQVALFDYLVNNADRKAGHLLEDRDGRLWVVDHGLTFNSVPKLRTVLWDFAGQTVPAELLTDVKALLVSLKRDGQLRRNLYQLLEKTEVEALYARIRNIIENPVFTYPTTRRSIPRPWI